MSEIKNRLKILRTDRGLTQEELAEIINKELKENEKPVSKMVISNWENNKHTIKQDKAQKLADFFKVPVSYLLGYESDEILLENLAKKIMNLSEEEFIEYSKTEDFHEEYELFEELYKNSEILNQKKSRVKQLKEIVSLLEGLDTDDLDILYPMVERLYFSRYSLEENEEFNKYRQTLKNDVRNP